MLDKNNVSTKFVVGDKVYFFTDPRNLTIQDECVFEGVVEAVEYQVKITKSEESKSWEKYEVSWEAWSNAYPKADECFATECEAKEYAKKWLTDLLNRRNNIDDVYRKNLDKLSFT